LAACIYHPLLKIGCGRKWKGRGSRGMRKDRKGKGKRSEGKERGEGGKGKEKGSP